METMELNLNELEMINGGWDWTRGLVSIGLAALVGANFGGAAGGGLGMVVGAGIGVAIGIANGMD